MSQGVRARDAEALFRSVLRVGSRAPGVLVHRAGLIVVESARAEAVGRGVFPRASSRRDARRQPARRASFASHAVGGRSRAGGVVHPQLQVGVVAGVVASREQERLTRCAVRSVEAVGSRPALQQRHRGGRGPRKSPPCATPRPIRRWWSRSRSRSSRWAGSRPSRACRPSRATKRALAAFSDRIDKSMAALLKVGPGRRGVCLGERLFPAGLADAPFWGTHYPRLAAVKRKYDPQGLFFVHHGVGSEAWSADGFTRV